MLWPDEISAWQQQEGLKEASVEQEVGTEAGGRQEAWIRVGMAVGRKWTELGEVQEAVSTGPGGGWDVG